MLPRVSGTKTRRHLLWRKWWACARRSRMNEHCTCTSQKYTERLGALCELEFHRHRIGAIFTWTSKLQHRWQTLLQDCSPSWAWGRVHRQSHMSKVTISSTVTVMPLSTLDTNKKKIYNIFGGKLTRKKLSKLQSLGIWTIAKQQYARSKMVSDEQSDGHSRPQVCAPSTQTRHDFNHIAYQNLSPYQNQGFS